MNEPQSSFISAGILTFHLADVTGMAPVSRAYHNTMLNPGEGHKPVAPAGSRCYYVQKLI